MDEEWEGAVFFHESGGYDESDLYGERDDSARRLFFEDERDRWLLDAARRKVVEVYGVAITAKDYPPCLDGSNVDCDECTFVFEDSYGRCRLRKSRRLRSLLWQAIAPWVEEERRRAALRDAIERELRLHGRALHYSVVSKMVQERYPHLHASDLSVYQTLRMSPEVFMLVSPGVYKARSK